MEANLDFGALTPAIEAEFRNGFQLNRVRAAVAAKRIAQATASRVHRSVDGLGSLMARIPPEAFHYWGQRLGYHCWNDDEFMRDFLRDNPECRVKSTGTKLQFGYTAPATPTVGYFPQVSQFHKTYASH